MTQLFRSIVRPVRAASSPLPRLVLAGLVAVLLGSLLTGCRSSRDAARDDDQLIVEGVVLLPDSSAVANAFVRTEPPTENIATDGQGRFQFTRLPAPGEYTFVATHPDPQYQNLDGRTTTTVEYSPDVRMIYIIIGKTQRMDLLDTGQQAVPARSRGKKRTGTR